MSTFSVKVFQKTDTIRYYSQPVRIFAVRHGSSGLSGLSCSITTGFAGVGAFSDGKLSLSPDVDGNLPEILGYDKTVELLKESDNIYLKFGADTNVSAIGREGSDWFSHICNFHGIETLVGTVDIGVHVEVRDEIMEFLNKNLYEAKLVYYTPTFGDLSLVFPHHIMVDIREMLLALDKVTPASPATRHCFTVWK